MVTDQEIEMLDKIEKKTVSEIHYFDKISKKYTDLLYELLLNQRFSGFTNEELKEIINHLKMRKNLPECNVYSADKNVGPLWRIADKYQITDPKLSALARCVIMCFETEERWLTNDTGEETPLFCFLFWLKKADPTLAPYFLSVFEER